MNKAVRLRQGNCLQHLIHAILLSLLFVCGAWAQEILIVPVRSYGQGANEASAIKDAIVQAVGQITGERLSASTSVSTRDAESTTRPAEHSATIENKIDSLIRGVVKSSQTVSVEKDASTGLYRATVDVRVASFKQSIQLNRVRLAVVMGRQPLPDSLGPHGQEFAQAMLNGLSDQFVSSRKFAVLDRQQQSAIQSEYARIQSGKAGVENFVRLQSAAAADFLVIANVENFTIGESVIGSTRAKTTVRAIVLDYTSGQVRQAVSANGTKTLKSSSLAPIGTQVGMNLAQQIIENVFPAKVIGIEGNAMTVSAGESQFQIGDAVQIYKQGRALKDPNTKENLGPSETFFAKGIVEKVTARVSVIKASDVNFNPGDIQKQSFIVRRDVDQENNHQVNFEKTEKKGNANDSDW